MRPIYPQPGYTENDVKSLLASRQFAFADCFTISPKYGDVLYLSTSGIPVRVVPFEGGDAITFLSPRNLSIEGLRLRVGIGTEVDEQELQLNYDQSAMAWGISLAKAIRLGRLDGATVRRDRFFARQLRSPSWMGGTPLFRGRMGSVDSISRTGANFKVKSDLILLNVSMPQDLFQPGCVHTLYDAGCTLDREDYAVSGTVELGSTSLTLKWTGSSPAFSLGMVHIDTPEGVTLVRTVLQATEDSLELAYPLDFVPEEGMSFQAYPGCNRTYERCGEFSNQEHYKGFPFVPVVETAA